MNPERSADLLTDIVLETVDATKESETQNL